MEEEELPSTIYSIISIYNKRLLMYETENGNLMKDGMIHFSFGILAAYMICLLGGGL